VPNTDIATVLAQQDLHALAQTIRTADQGVSHAATNLIEHALAAGDALIAAKAKVGHGGWLKYLKNECDLSEDRAERYVRIARGREVLMANSARVRNLSLAQALRVIDADARKARPPRTAEPRASKPPKAKNLISGLSSFAWSAALPAERTKFLNAIGLGAVRAAAPATWDFEISLTVVPTEALLRELERRKPAQIPNKRNTEVTVLGRAEKHDGPTLEHEPNETKH
jgi:hypothetical protein